MSTANYYLLLNSVYTFLLRCCRCSCRRRVCVCVYLCVPIWFMRCASNISCTKYSHSELIVNVIPIRATERNTNREKNYQKWAICAMCARVLIFVELVPLTCLLEMHTTKQSKFSSLCNMATKLAGFGMRNNLNIKLLFVFRSGCFPNCAICMAKHMQTVDISQVANFKWKWNMFILILVVRYMDCIIIEYSEYNWNWISISWAEKHSKKKQLNESAFIRRRRGWWRTTSYNRQKQHKPLQSCSSLENNAQSLMIRFRFVKYTGPTATCHTAKSMATLIIRIKSTINTIDLDAFAKEKLMYSTWCRENTHTNS